MSLIRPFPGLRPVAAQAAAVVAPPYDVLSTDEARERAAGKPWSFLHVSKPEIDLAQDTDPYSPAVYAKGAENLARMSREGILQRDDQPLYYVYRLIMGEHTQTGLVAVASVAAYDANRIRKHEFTRPDKEDDRVRNIDALNAQTGPVFLAYRADPNVDNLLGMISGDTPEVDVTADDGVRHSLWVVRDGGQLAFLTKAFDAMDHLYIADGHHRSAAASRVAAQRRAANPRHTGEEAYNYFLSVIFPHDQLRILDYNRVIKDLNGLSAKAFLDRIGDDFDVITSDIAVRPRKEGEFGAYLDGRWYRLEIKDGRVDLDDPVARLDVSVLSDFLIEPVLGISDPRRDKRIDFIGGIRGLQALEKRVDSGAASVAFSLYPTQMEALMAVADAAQVMPPKSTWFEPKLADGLVSHVLD
jgi:uncharacterized protein (DUF1015 family)